MKELATTTAGQTIGRAELGGALGGISGEQTGVLCGAMPRHSFTETAADKLRWNCTWITCMELHPERTNTIQQGSIEADRLQKRVTDASGENRMNISRD